MYPRGTCFKRGSVQDDVNAHVNGTYCFSDVCLVVRRFVCPSTGPSFHTRNIPKKAVSEQDKKESHLKDDSDGHLVSKSLVYWFFINSWAYFISFHFSVL